MKENNIYKPLSLILSVLVVVLGSIILILVTKKNSLEIPLQEGFFGDKVPIHEKHAYDTIPIAEANKMIASYDNYGILSQMIHTKAVGLWHNYDSVLKYVNTTFPKFKTTHTDKPVNCDWQLGFYFMLSKSSRVDKPRISFCLIPTLIDSTKKIGEPARIHSYTDDVNKPYYVATLATTDGSYIYDTGEIWP